MALLCSSVSHSALANPVDGTVVGGSATISSNGSTLTVNQSTSKAIIDWRGFDIGAGETTQFNQPGSSALTLNRVTSSGSSHIDGTLKANGNILIVNQNGVVFGQGSKVDVNSLIATTSDIRNDDFMAGNLKFSQPGNPMATIENRGTITAQEAGLVGLVAPNVINSGTINARLGRVQLASGDSFTLDLYGDGLMELKASDAIQSQLVQNTGTINAEGGSIALTAAAGASVVNSLIDVGGTLNARGVGEHDGKIFIYAEGVNDHPEKTGSSTVRVHGTLDVSNTTSKGGRIDVLADHVEIQPTARLNADGETGGGEVHVGGDFHGANTLARALTTSLAQGSVITANATGGGDAGAVSVWSDDATSVGGRISANALGETGNGGMVETSGGRLLIEVEAGVTATSRRKRAGTWLLDPADITINGTDASSSNSGGIFTATNTGSSINAATIKSVLDGGTSVTVQTTNDGYAGNGDITVSSAITTTGSGSLTLSAYRNISVNAAITLQGGSLTLRSNNAGAADGSTGSGAIYVGGNITTNGGNVTIGGGNGAITAGSGYAVGNGLVTALTARTGYGVGVAAGIAVNAGGGNIIMNGIGYNTSTDYNFGVYINGGTVSTTNSGSIAISGIGGAGTGSSGSNIGIDIDRSGSGGTISTLNGDITLVGTAGGSGAGANNYGVYIAGTGSTIKTAGSGALNVTGYGGNLAGTGGNNHGIYSAVTNGITTTGSGSITLKGVKGGQSTSYGIYGDAANEYTTTGSGNITFYTDTINLAAASTINSIGNLTLASYSNQGMSIGTSVASTTNISNTQLGYLNAASYVFGSTTTADGVTANTGNITVNTTNNFGSKNVTVNSGGNIIVAGNLSWATGNLYTFLAVGGITINSGVTISNTYTGSSFSAAMPVVLVLRADSAAAVNGSGVSTNSYGVTNNGTINMSASSGAVSIFNDNGFTAVNGTQTGNASWAVPTNSSLSGQFGTYKLVNGIGDLTNIGTNSTTLGYTYALGANINGGGAAFNSNVPLGTFTGLLDGQLGALLTGTNYGISNFTLNSSSTSGVGLFSLLSGIVRNLSVNMAITSNSSNTGGTDYVGIVAGTSTGKVANVSTSGSITYTGSSTATAQLGGVVGGTRDCCGLILIADSSSATISGTSTVSGSATSTMNIGGLVGYIGAWGATTITNSSASGAVTYNYQGTSTGTSGVSIGGLWGGAGGYGGTVSGSSSSGAVRAQYVGGYSGNVNASIGGLAGTSSATLSTSSTTTSTVTDLLGGSGSTQYIGGLVGYNSSTISGINFSGPAVSYTGNSGTVYIGGLVGGGAGSTLSGVSVSSAVTATSTASGSASTNFYVGGLIGAGGLNGGTTITNSSASGAVTYNYQGTSTATSAVGIGGLWGGTGGYGGTVSGSSSSGAVLAQYASGYSGNVNGTVGGLAGSSNATIGTSTTTSTISDLLGGSSAVQYLGGLVGYMSSSSTISGINFSGPAVSYTGNSGTVYIGGLLGGAKGGTYTGDSTSNAVTATTTVSGSNTSTVYIGGFIGSMGLNNTATTITGSSSSGAVTYNYQGTSTGTSSANVGGFMGAPGGWGGALSGSSATGAVLAQYSGGYSGNVNGLIGGLLGANNTANVSTSFASGNVTSSLVGGNEYIGGLVGQNSYNNATAVANTYATGAVRYTGNTAGALIGGLVGNNSAGTISSSYSTGYVSASAGTAGGFAGANTGTLTNDYWDSLTSGKATSAGAATAQTTTQLQSALPTGFSNSTWSIVAGTSYPYLLSQFASGTPQVVSGIAYSNRGTTALAGNSVGILVNGVNTASVFGPTQSSGANGYYYFLLAPTTLASPGSQVFTYLTGATKGNRFYENASASLSGFDIWGNELWTTSASTALSTLTTNLAMALGSNSGSNFLFTLSSGAITATAGSNLEFSLTAATFDIDKAMTASASGAVILNDANSLTQSVAITTPNILLNSGGSYTLSTSGNSIGTLAGSTGALTLADSSALTVGTILGTAGLTASGAVSLSTDSLTASNSISVSGQTVTITPYTTGATIGLGTGAGSLQLTNSTLTNITAGSYIFGSLLSGDVTVNTTNDFGTKNVSFISGNNISIAGGLTKASTANSTYLFKAVHNIGVNSGANSSFNGSNVVMQANATDSGSGFISIGGSISTNGGSLTLGGGSDITTGYAYGNSTQRSGVAILGPSITTGSGAVTIRGHGYDSGSGNYGFYMNSGGQLSSSGVVSITGVGGNGTNTNYGVFLSNFNGVPKSVSAATLTVTGTGGGSGTSDYGILTQNGFFLSASGAMTLNGTASGTSTIANVLSGNLTASGGLLTLNGATQLTADVTLTGTGVTLNSTLDGDTASTRSLTVNGGTGAITTSGALGGSTSLNAVSLTSANALTLPSITAASIFARTTGATSDITIASGKTLAASGAGNAITLASGRNFINSAATPFSLSGGGRWLVYSTNPSADSLNSLASGFVRYGCTYGGSCPTGVTIPGSGNGLVYTYQPTLTITPTALAALTYGDAAPSLAGYSYGVTGYLTGAAGSDLSADTLSGSLTGSTAYTPTSNVGTYGLNYSSGALTSALGYQFTYANNASAISVGKKQLTATANGQTVTYGTTVPSTTVTYAGFVNGEDSSVIDTQATVSSAYSGVVNAGTYAGNYTASGAVDNNYSFTYAAGDLTVSKKTLNVTAGNQTITYGDALPAGTLAYNGFIAGEDASYLSTAPTVSSALSGIQNVGSYVGNYTASGGVSNNYNFLYTPGTLTVSAAGLNITAGNRTITYGDAVPVGSFVITGFVNGENQSVLTSLPTLSSTASGVVNAGTYAGNYVTSGGAAANYYFNYIAGDLVVNKKALNVSLNNQTVTYGAVVPTDNYTISGFVNGEDSSVIDTLPTVQSAHSGVVNAGTYAGNYTASGAVDNNYSFNYNTGTLNVGKATLVATVANQSITYGTSVPTSSVSYTGFVNGEDSSVIDTQATVSSAYSGVVNAGTYTGNYTASGAVDNNYSFTYAAGNLQVDRRALLVTTASVSKLQTDPDPSFSGSNNLLAADAAQVGWSYAPAGYSGAPGNYTIAAIASDPNSRLANYLRTNNYGIFAVTSTAPVVTPTATVVPPSVQKWSQIVLNPLIPTNAPAVSGTEVVFFTPSSTDSNGHYSPPSSQPPSHEGDLRSETVWVEMSPQLMQWLGSSATAF